MSVKAVDTDDALAAIGGHAVRTGTVRVRRAAAVAVVAIAATAAAALAGAAGGDAGGDAMRAPAANASFRASLISACVRAERPARVRALAFDGAQLPASVGAGHEPGSRPRCDRRELRVLRFEALRIGGERTYVRRGGCALPCVVRQATVHVPAGAFAERVRLLPRAARNGNGEPVPGCTERVRNTPQAVGAELRRMYYKTPAELHARRNAGRSGGIGASWSNYGDPGATYRSPGGRRAHYNYLLWNLPRAERGLLPGGGIARAILRGGQPLVLCAGQRLTLPAFDRDGAFNGEVTFGYARVRGRAGPRGGSYAIHGWVLLGYRYRDRPFVATVAG